MLLRRLELLLAPAVILLADPHWLHRRGHLWGDAQNSWLWAFRWFGATTRAGVFGDYFPYAFSGYSHGWNVEYGLYNPLYQLCAVLFVDSSYSVRLAVFLQYLMIFALAALLAQACGLSRVAIWYTGFAVLSCGFVVAHAQHLSYLAAAIGLLGNATALLRARHGQRLGPFLLAWLATWHGCSAGYPTIVLFGAQVLCGLALVLLLKGLLGKRAVFWLGAGVALGVLCALPALVHTAVGLSLSARGQGLVVDAALAPFGGLPVASLWDLAWPLRTTPIAGFDGSMDRFHGLWSTTVLLVLGFGALHPRVGLVLERRRFLMLVGAAALLFWLAAGDQVWPPLRRYLALYLPWFRFGRFYGAEAQPVALVCLILASAFVLDALLVARPRWRHALFALIVLDAFVIQTATAPLRSGQVRKRSVYAPPLPRFRAVLSESDQALLDAPRHCDATLPLDAYQALYSRPQFSYWGYAPLVLADYTQAREALRPVLCQGGRLFDAATQTPVPYRLLRYEPGVIAFALDGEGVPAELLWAETDDGFWRLWVDGAPVPLLPGPGRLRRWHMAQTSGPHVVEMRYRGPLSWIFR